MSIKRLSGWQLSEGVSGQGLAERTGRPAPEGPPAPSNAAAARPATVAGEGGTNVWFAINKRTGRNNHPPACLRGLSFTELLRLTPSIIP